MTYETIAGLAKTGGLIYFVVLFAVVQIGRAHV